MDKLKSALGTLGPPPTVDTDGTSVVTMREIKDVRVKSLNMKIEIESDLENKPGNAAPSKADYSACDGSVVCADTLSNVEADTMDLSVCVNKSKVRAEQVDETPQPSNKGPAVRFIIDHKVELIKYLRADPCFILQHVHAQNIVTDGQYLKIKSISEPEKAAVEIIDQVICKGQDFCSLFLGLLKISEVLETYPELQKILDLM